mgnify:CR=1 FL=1
MIISRTPYRVSFAGGGTDLPAFFRHEPGAVISTAFNRYLHVTVHRGFEPNIRVAYSKTETAERVDDIQHELVRESLRLTGIDEPLEITTIGDVPAGTGMGSSSSLTVGLLTALHGYRGRLLPADTIADQACRIEIDHLGKPIGKQDQYAAAFGGLNVIHFQTDGGVRVEPVPCAGDTLEELQRRVLLLYTGQTRDANTLLDRQSRDMDRVREARRRSRDLVEAMRSALCGSGGLDEFARLLHEGWLIKRSLDTQISDPRIDAWYDAALKAGAGGGKLLGAGGGGFLLLLAPSERHRVIEEALGRPRRMDIRFEPTGGRIIFHDHLP